ncbi:MAG: D-alanine--poly(phosphoribitol) ligase subunit DltC [Anaerovoracaceae bacterium]|nr:D-alanine--poly(phosphoribitol) ligase subunit DltC [Anaerovoracaceae bacterium]
MENKEIIVRETVLALLEDICGDDAVRADGDINLLEEDLMDSLDYTELLVGIEEALSVTMAPSEFKREEMDTPNKIIGQVLRRVR